MAARREQGFYSTHVSVSSVDILPNSETKSHIKKKRSCRSLAIANAASERKQALIEIIRKSSCLLLVSDCLSSQKKKIVLYNANFAIDSNLLWTESRGVCSERFKMVECFSLSRWRCKKGHSLSFSLLIP